MITPADIIKARTDAALTQSEMAAMLHKSVRTVQDWEQGRRNMPESDFELFLMKTRGMKNE
jgi:DNA-binding transcriptional regulator YiaG